MTNALKKKLDFVPLIVLFISAGYALWAYLDEHILLKWQHFFGFSMIIVTAIVFFLNHKLGVLMLGLTIIIGLVGLISITPGISSLTIGKSFDGEEISLFRFQPIFLLWAILHFLFSGRYYVGVASEKYWRNINSDEPFKIV